jgi:hypothetical protein
MFNYKPTDDLSQQLLLFLSQAISNALPLSSNQTLEIEAKLGILKDKTSQNRIRPVNSEAIVIYDSHFVFDSGISQEHHSAFNRLLNHLIHPKSKTKYTHSKTLDSFYTKNHVKLRSTEYLDQGAQKKIIISKKRISDIEISCPNSPFDVRISVNIESTSTFS